MEVVASRELVVPFIAAGAGEVNDAAIIQLLVRNGPSVVMTRDVNIRVLVP